MSAEVENEFLPWLMESVVTELHKSEVSRQVLDGMIREVVRARSEQFAELEQSVGDGTILGAEATTTESGEDVPPKEVCN